MLGEYELDCSLGQLWTFVFSGWMRQLNRPRPKVSDVGDACLAIGKVRGATARPLCLVVETLNSTVGRSTLAALLELRNKSPVPFGVVFISTLPWHIMFPDAELEEPQHVHFPAYTKEQILDILWRQRPETFPPTPMRLFLRASSGQRSMHQGSWQMHEHCWTRSLMQCLRELISTMLPQ